MVRPRAHPRTAPHVAAADPRPLQVRQGPDHWQGGLGAGQQPVCPARPVRLGPVPEQLRVEPGVGRAEQLVQLQRGRPGPLLRPAGVAPRSVGAGDPRAVWGCRCEGWRGVGRARCPRTSRGRGTSPPRPDPERLAVRAAEDPSGAEAGSAEDPGPLGLPRRLQSPQRTGRREQPRAGGVGQRHLLAPPAASASGRCSQGTGRPRWSGFGRRG